MSELKTRDQMPNEFKWNLTSIYKSDEEWQKSFDALSSSYQDIRKYEGKLAESSENLANCLLAREDLMVEAYKLYVYANLKKDEDTANSVYQGMADRVSGLVVKCSSAISFIDPETIAIGQDKVNAFINENEKLKIFKHQADDLFRLQKHVLSADKEELMAKASEIGGAASNIFGMINNADMVFAKAKDEKGELHEVTLGRMGSLMENTDRTLRKNVFNCGIDPYIAQKNTIAEAYNFSVKNDLFVASVRNHESALDAALSNDNIPKEIYKNLINTVNDNLHLYHRYMELRKKCLKYDELCTWDMAVPIVENADTFMNWEDAKTNVIEGLAALGKDYQELVKKGFNEGWVDVYENKGKRSGAYSWGTYGAPHPFVLMNYDDTIGDMFTLAHEMGHALHSYYTKENQPSVYGSYTIFLAEIASTVNEALLMDHLLGKTTDKTKYNYLLNYFMQQFVGTFFRQTMFAEFEMITHEMAEQGKPLNSESLNAVYFDLAKKYFGPGVVIDEKVAFVWSRVPHFYCAFYVYQYATGFASAIAFSKKIREEGAPAVEKYLNLLKSGSKDYSINLLKEAGLDMTSPEPIKDALSVFEDLLDRFEKANF